MTDYVTKIWKCRSKFRETEARLNRQLERLAMNMTCDTMTLADRIAQVVEQKRRLALAADALRQMADALTGEESAVISRISCGDSVSDVANMRGCTIGHVRRTYANAFNKCANILRRKYIKDLTQSGSKTRSGVAVS